MSQSTVGPGTSLDCYLYAGERIESAVEESDVDVTRLVTDRSAAARWFSLLLAEIQSGSWRTLNERFCVVRGREASTGALLCMHFRGNLRIVDFCATQILGSPHYSVETGRKARRNSVPDLVVDYNRLRFFFVRKKRCFLLPHRVDQFLSLKPSWQETLQSLPAKHRKEIRRQLRKNNYSATLCHGEEAVRHFYHHAYLPYAAMRFGGDANIGSERSFLSKHRRNVVLWLTVDGIPQAANLLCWEGKKLCIEQSGATHSDYDRPGLFDSLDYFSLVLAQATACDELDFGGSRPHLRHGIFRYKAKWNTSIRPPRKHCPKIRIRVLNDSRAVRGFLQRNLFLQLENGELVIKVLVDSREADGEFLERIVHETRRTGLKKVLVIAGDHGREYLADDPAEGVRIRMCRKSSEALPGYLESR